MSKATIVTTLPFTLSERKPGLFPSLFEIPKAPQGGINVAVIGDAYYTELIPFSDANAAPRKIDILSIKIAESVCNDYMNSCLGVSYDPLANMSMRVPGLFAVEEAYDVTSVRKHFPDKINTALRNTVAWFEGLIKIADDDWQRYHQHKMITDIQREACKYIGADREWNFSAFDIVSNLCPACQTAVNPKAIVCATCQCIIKPELYKSEMFAAPKR